MRAQQRAAVVARFGTARAALAGRVAVAFSDVVQRRQGRVVDAREHRQAGGIHALHPAARDAETANLYWYQPSQEPSLGS